MRKLLAMLLVAFIVCCCVDKLYAQEAPIEGSGTEVWPKKGRASFNCCHHKWGTCHIFIADVSDDGTYTIPALTSVIYAPDYGGPYLEGTYADDRGRMRVDNVVVTFKSCDCIDPETGKVEEDCKPGEDEDLYFTNR